MRKLQRVSLVLASVLLVATVDAQSIRTGSAESVGMSSARLAKIKPAMKAAVDTKQVAAVETLVARRGVIVHNERVAVEPDTIFRLASMTKPVTSVAIMMLMEDGKLLLSDPVFRFVPSFKDMRVLDPAASTSHGDDPGTVPAKRAITIEDLLTHRSGLIYGFMETSPVGEMYKKSGVCDAWCTDKTLAQNVDLIARQPLKFHPGSAYQYSVSIDVLGRVVEVVSGQTLDEFFQQRIFEPLRMRDTYFNVPAAKTGRLAAMFLIDKGELMRAAEEPVKGSATYFAGGAGLAGTTSDYLRFAQMLLNGGELDGVRLLSPTTVDLMMSSHTQDLGPSAVSAGHGFGYGGYVREALGRSTRPTPEGTFGWSGAFGTYFTVDRKHQMVTLLMHQLNPRSNRTADVFQALAYAAIDK